MNNPHQQPSKESMKTSVKIQETHLTTKKNGVLQKFPAKRRLGEDENGDEEKKREEEEKVIELTSSSLISLAYIKQEKAKSKTIFDFGRNY